MEVGSSTEMGAPGASHLGTGDRGPKTDRSRPRSVPVNALVVYECRVNSRAVGQAEVIRFTRYAARWGQGRIGSSAMVSKNSGAEKRKRRVSGGAFA